MSRQDQRPPNSSFQSLRKLIRPPSSPQRCALCSAAISRDHSHLLELKTRQLRCACQACALLFEAPSETQYRRVPRGVRFLPEFQMTAEQWESLLIPIGIAFLVNRSAEGRIVAVYPSPAGGIESEISADDWTAILKSNPVLERMQPDVEALLVNRLRDPGEYYLAAIDQCYQLTGMIRKKWRGLGGGSEVWEEIRQYFERLSSGSSRQAALAPLSGEAGGEAVHA